MPRKKGISKNVLLATRVTPKIRDIVAQMAYREGLNVSEWLRNLIISELKENQVLPTVFRSPNLELSIDE
ncbi:MAG: plasmid mobilization protein [Promethearchaeota archaeon]|jgi:hypothetical protein